MKTRNITLYPMGPAAIEMFHKAMKEQAEKMGAIIIEEEKRKVQVIRPGVAPRGSNYTAPKKRRARNQKIRK